MATSPGKFLTIAGVAIFTCVSFAQDLNPFIGTWDIDLAASSFGSAAVSKNMSRVYEDAGNGSYMFLVVSIAEDGSIGGSSATYKFDNKENPLASLSLTAPATISYIQNNEKIVQYTVRVDGRVSQIGAKTISPDGRILTIAIQTFSAEGDINNQILKFNRRR